MLGLAAVKAFATAVATATEADELSTRKLMDSAALAGLAIETTRAAGMARANALLIRLILIVIRPPEIAEGVKLNRFNF